MYIAVGKVRGGFAASYGTVTCQSVRNVENPWCWVEGKCVLICIKLNLKIITNNIQYCVRKEAYVCAECPRETEYNSKLIQTSLND